MITVFWTSGQERRACALHTEGKIQFVIVSVSRLRVRLESSYQFLRHAALAEHHSEDVELKHAKC